MSTERDELDDAIDNAMRVVSRLRTEASTAPEDREDEDLLVTTLKDESSQYVAAVFDNRIWMIATAAAFVLGMLLGGYLG